MYTDQVALAELVITSSAPQVRSRLRGLTPFKGVPFVVDSDWRGGGGGISMCGHKKGTRTVEETTQQQ